MSITKEKVRPQGYRAMVVYGTWLSGLGTVVALIFLWLSVSNNDVVSVDSDSNIARLETIMIAMNVNVVIVGIIGTIFCGLLWALDVAIDGTIKS